MQQLVSKEKVNQFIQLLKNKHQVTIFTHHNPDGDAIGSVLAFQMALKQKNIDSEIFITNEIPESLAWLKGAKNIHENATIETVEQRIETTHLITCLDFNEPSRIAHLSSVLENRKKPVLVIDHHPKSFDYNGLDLSETAASSTSELLYWLLKESKMIVKNSDFAECIYTGIVTDTGSFAYNSSAPSTFYAIAELLEIGFDKNRVNNLVFQQFKVSRMQLLGHLLANRMVFMKAYQTAYTYLTKKDLETHNFESGDTEGFVNYPLSIADVRFTAFFIEKDNEIKVSFRSKGNYAANAFSKRFFGGGGHQNAAGGRSCDNLQDTLTRFEMLVKKHGNEF